MLYRNLIVFCVIILSSILFSCSVDISGAPCNTDENCPKGQHCQDGKCIRGVPSDITDLFSGKDIFLDTIEIKDNLSDSYENDTLNTDDITDIFLPKCRRDSDCTGDIGKYICVNNECIEGECRENKDCTMAGYPTCNSSYFCTNRCDENTNCGSGYVCCEETCKIGTCCKDTDCGDNMKCINNICAKECEKNEDCSSLRCCDRSICAEKERGCCNSLECENSKYGFACINYLCSCTSDYECPKGKICDRSQTPPVCKDGCSDISKCPIGYLCCDGKCKKGECCTSKDCRKAGYPTCEEINGENICVDLCEPLFQNPCNSVDNKFRCCMQNDNSYRCVIAKCCDNNDCVEPNKPYCETALEEPDCVNKCEPENIKCGSVYVCCSAFNGYMCFSGDCCDEKDCSDSKKCIGYHCVEGNCKSEPSICNASEKCCQSGQLEGICYKGECCSDEQCSTDSKGTKCLLDRFTCGCNTKSDCQSGYVCKDNVCIIGDCITDSDCTDISRPICINNKCSPCSDSIQCQNAHKGDICCSGYCKSGECCSSTPDCNEYITKPVCKNGLCSPCVDNNECSIQNLGDKCCKRGVLAGDCYTGNCCSSYDCIEAGLIKRPICHSSDYDCYPCKSDAECKNEFNDNQLKCCSVKSSSLLGSCFKGECCDNSQCTIFQSRPICNLQTNMCVECLSNNDCGILGANYVCCNNQCIKGECCKDTDCLINNRGDTCYQYHCRKHCKSANECIGTSIYNDCCSNITTSPFPFCVPEQKGRCCIGDSDCDNLYKCCFGICIFKNIICN